MILLLLGTHEQPFERAVDIVLRLTPEHELVVQHGHTPARPGVPGNWLEFAPYEQITSLCREAEAVFCHAGVGTIMTAIAAAKRPVVIPRLARYNEHVDDHQLQIARQLETQGLVIVIDDGGDPLAALARGSQSIDQVSRGDALKRAVATAVG